MLDLYFRRYFQNEMFNFSEDLKIKIPA